MQLPDGIRIGCTRICRNLPCQRICRITSTRSVILWIADFIGSKTTDNQTREMMRITGVGLAYPGHLGAMFDGVDSAAERPCVTPTSNGRLRLAQVQGS